MAFFTKVFTGFGAFPGVGPAGVDTFGGIDIIGNPDIAIQVIPGVSAGKVRIDSISYSAVAWNGTVPTTHGANVYGTVYVLAAKIPPSLLESFFSQLFVPTGINSPPSLNILNKMGARLLWQQEVGVGAPNFGETHDFETLRAEENETVFVVAGWLNDVTAAWASVRSLVFLTTLGEYEYPQAPQFTLR